MERMKNLSILVILVLVLIGVTTSGCAKKEKTQEELRKEIEPYLKEIEADLKSTESLIRNRGFKRCEELEKILKKNMPQIIPVLTEIIKDKNQYIEVRLNIARILGSIGPPEVIVSLGQRLLESYDEATQNCAIRLLTSNSSDLSIDVLIQLLEKENSQTSVIWIMATSNDELIKKWNKDKRLKNILIKLSKNKRDNVALPAISIIEKMHKK